MSTECSPNLWSNVPTWLIVFGGWFAVHKMTLRRERRKEKRELAKAICSDIREVEQTALNFHCGAHFDARTYSDIREHVDRILLHLQKAPLSELKIETSLMVALRQSITLQNTDPSDFMSKMPDDDLIRDVRSAVFDLIVSIDTNRDKIWE